MTPAHDRRQRLHELVIALIAQQDDVPLHDPDQPDLEGTAPGRWLDQNRRSLHRYQALVRTAVTLDALLDAEDNPSPLPADISLQTVVRDCLRHPAGHPR